MDARLPACVDGIRAKFAAAGNAFGPDLAAVPAEAGFSPHLDRGSGKMQADGMAAGGVRQEGGRTANGGKEGEKMSEG